MSGKLRLRLVTDACPERAAGDHVCRSASSGGGSPASTWPLVLLLGLQAALLLGPLSRQSWTLLKGSRSYTLIADDLVRHGDFLTGYRPPLYPCVIAASKWLAPDAWKEVLFGVHVLLALACGGLVYLIAQRVCRRSGPALLAVGLFVTHVLLQLELLAARETALYVFLELAFFYVWCSGVAGRATFPVLGVMAGLAHLTRPNGLFLLIVLGAVTMLASSGASPPRKRFASVAAAALAFAAVVLPWQVKLHSITGAWSLSSSSSSGLNLWKGNNRFTSYVLPWLEVDELDEVAKSLVPGSDFTAPESDRVLNGLAWRHILADPAKSALLGLKKGALFLAPIPIPWGTGVIQETPDGVLIDDFKPRRGWLLFSLHTCLMYVGVALLLVHSRRTVASDARQFVLGVAALVGISIALHSITFPETRLRLPLDALLLVGAAAGFSAAVADRRTRGARVAPSGHAYRADGPDPVMPVREATG